MNTTIFGQEKPLYVLKQDKKRALLPKIITLILLGILFYIGVLLNVALLDLTAKEETSGKIFSLIIVIFLIVLGIYLAVRQSKLDYIFYPNRIEQGRKSISYLEMENVLPHRDLLDRMFNTTSYHLGKDFFLRHIPQEINLSNYLQQLQEYAKRRSGL